MKRRHFLRAAGILPLGAAAIFLAGREKTVEGVFPAQAVDPESRSISTLERQHKTPAHAAYLVPGSEEPDKARSEVHPNLDKLLETIDFSAVYLVQETYHEGGKDTMQHTHAPLDAVRIFDYVHLMPLTWPSFVVTPNTSVFVSSSGHIRLESAYHKHRHVSFCHMWPETYDETLSRLNEKHNSLQPKLVNELACREGVKQIDLATWFEKLKTLRPVLVKTDGPYALEYRPWVGHPVDGHRRAAVVDIHPAGRPYPKDKPLPKFIHPPTNPKIVADIVNRQYGFAEPGLMSLPADRQGVIGLQESVDKVILKQVDEYLITKGQS